MSLEQHGAQHNKGVVNKFHDPTTDYQMTTRDYVLRPKPGADGSGAITITLPPVAEAKGRWYSIIARAVNGGTITVQDKDDSECWGGDITMNSTCDRMLCYSDGISWLCFFGNNNAPS